METNQQATFWWLKNSKTLQENGNNLKVPPLNLEISSSLADFLEKEGTVLSSNRTELDVGRIIDEINRVAAQSPLGPYEHSHSDRSVDDILKEAERVYMESSHSFEHLSASSRISHNKQGSKESTPSPKSVSPLPRDDSDDETYSEDFSSESKTQTDHGESPMQETMPETPNFIINRVENGEKLHKDVPRLHKDVPRDVPQLIMKEVVKPTEMVESRMQDNNNNYREFVEKIEIQNELIKELEVDNKQLREEVRMIKSELQQTTFLLDQTKASLSAKSICSPAINIELEKTLEELKDAKEINTALQLQLDTINKTHCLLKSSYEDLLTSNKTLERRVAELDTTLGRYRNELTHLQSTKDKLLENEQNLNKVLEIEKLQTKSLKLQNEKDARCIQDLNRQIKEMERIIARKHPDSVSALIVAAKNDASDTNLTARKILEDRIKTLEEEASKRDNQSSKIFVDIQDKFNQMKLKYESHIEDLELHVSDLKTQLKRKSDTYDIYTQTANEDCLKIPQKDTFTVCTQTEPLKLGTSKKSAENKDDSHLVATIRGLQTDLSNKEKVVSKLQRDVDELRKTNRKLQKEREGSLKNLNERKNPDEVKALRTEKDKMKQQLCRIEQDYQTLKSKRLHDLTALQEAHEREIASYANNVTPLREQLELQQVTISTLQSQLTKAKEELLILTVERDHCNSHNKKGVDGKEVESLQKKISYLEKRYEEREVRLRAIVHELAQKNITNRSCNQCAERQQELIGYKLELDQLLETLRSLN